MSLCINYFKYITPLNYYSSRNRLSIFFTLTLLILFESPFIQANLESKEHSLSPYFLLDNSSANIDSFPLKNTDVKANISGTIAHIEVSQTYKNLGNTPINAEYIFPASTQVAVHGLIMTIGEHLIKAKIEKKERAQEEFNKAKTEGKNASLLEQIRPNIFKMSVSNIMPGDEIKIKLNYSENIIPKDSIYEFIYPTVVGPRYKGINDNPKDEWTQSPFLNEGKTSNHKININTNLFSGIPIKELKCTSHETEAIWHKKNHVEIKLKSTDDKRLNRDYILKYKLKGEKIESGVLLHEGEKENFFMCTIQPPQRIKMEEIPAREYIFIMDVSGSMKGFPLDISKSMMRSLLQELRPNDKFNIILFAGQSNSYSSQSISANKNNIEKALEFINNQNSRGGTELLSALEEAYQMKIEDEYSRNFVIITDGYINAEKDVFTLIHNNLNIANLFAFGIGSSVNRYLIEGMAKAGQGEPFIVTNQLEALHQAQLFQEYISTPILTNINFRFNELDVYDLEPKVFPDLLANRPIILTGKYRGKAAGSIVIEGINGLDLHHQEINIESHELNTQNQALPYLWAKSKVSRLSDYNFDLNDEDLTETIANIGLKYRLLTKHTSFIAVHEMVRNTNSQAKNITQSNELPKGVSNLVNGSITPKAEVNMTVSNKSIGETKHVSEPEIPLLIGFLVSLYLVYRHKFKVVQE